MQKGFDPVYDGQTRILILGSAPSIVSLRKNQYYGNAGNYFWRIIFDCLKLPVPEDYQERLVQLKAHHIGLWDVYGYFNRTGSADTNFKETRLNDFSSLLAAAPIERVIANGKKAYHEVMASGIFSDYEVVQCLSTSGANNSRMADRKIDWQQALTPIL
ncbi:DNA-deoxyinosine glycosylase [Vagococcus acidifermentans]|uniref:DNA-deoxyinosine glycosylase n=1 Tax=Vagococcus acidifermentans TaxID=564710 RepID=A0A430B311_9ENTE|nr:DNA-deoxyinosine glycosylase [Vagococcus acidifermentans]RSU14698.1 DNA-deoxyinosine glycosylase [Vagococcus acidifermentans]